ncbi:MAG: bifunctional proline dehydrogenase/L-glutamate gamma-semialdehyde dehydrogenase [Microbacteriaceae bacterium]|nr:bifunctional proline dehydrogenase/L-glutamate gamma-semialdehyde dehydrogenase [Microbacteriaceae bacterium]
MLPDLSRASTRPPTIAADTVSTVRRWLNESSDVPRDRSAERLAGLLRDARGLDFALGFVDRVVRPEDLRVAARNFEQLSRSVPAFLPWYLRLAVVFGGGFALIAPWPIVPIARFALRRMVSHLILDATPKRLDRSIAALTANGAKLNLNLLGEAVLGDAEADRRLAGTRELLLRDDVDYVSIKVSAVASQLSMWAFDETVERIAVRLLPLYQLAARVDAPGTGDTLSADTPSAAARPEATDTPRAKFINLDMEEFRDLDLTIAVFTRILDTPELAGLEAGIVLQAYLPDALGALQRLTTWATDRRAAGGSAIKVRIVKGANLAMEHVDATLHGWPMAPFSTKCETDANYKRVLNWALTAEHTEAVRIGIAGHNLFDLAFAWHLIQHRGVADRVEFEMLLGMATEQATAVAKDVGALRLYTPVVHPGEFDSAISYLIRRLEENASPENFLSGIFELASSEAVFDRESERFLVALSQLDDEFLSTHRVQDRHASASRKHVALSGDASSTDARFRNAPDTDPAIAANRAWARQILQRSVDSTLGMELASRSIITAADVVEKIIDDTHAAGVLWGRRPAAERADVVRSAARSIESVRAELIEVMVSETGKTLAEADTEVSEAVDFAGFYADLAPALDQLPLANFVPSALIVVVPPWNFPVAIAAGGILAALASGSAVIMKPAPQAARCAAVLTAALWNGGVPRELLQLVNLAEDDRGPQLISHPRVDRVILTGGWHTAELFRSWDAELPLLAETSGKNAIVVTPGADLDLAVADVVKSAFGHAGQKCSAASLLILVGSVADSPRFERQLVDAVRSIQVGWSSDARTQVGPIIEPAVGKLLWALTELAEGERWLVEPEQLDDSGRLFSPGLRAGVVAGSTFHQTEFFGPVLGIMRAATLAEAVALQNATEFGLTAGIHSLDSAEIAYWLDTVEAGNLYVNRSITGAIVRRQPFGGWKRSAVGPGAKAGGPNYLFALGDIEPLFTEPQSSVSLTGLSERVTALIEAAQPGMKYLEFDRVRTAALSDHLAWSAEFSRARDVSKLDVERNVLRYRPAEITLRLSEGSSASQLVRLLAAASLTSATVAISSALPVHAGLMVLFRSDGSPVAVTEVVVETDAAFAVRLRNQASRPTRIRLVGGSAPALAEALSGSADVAIYSQPVTTEGRIELLPFLREQSISITAHRFGNPNQTAQLELS